MKASISYEQLNKSMIESHTLIINTSPLGMFPNVNEAPPIAYEGITAEHHLYDLVYNPIETLFMQNGLAKGATVQNGLAMLHIQAEESWAIWNAKM
jgi:shikimate dehydrogenase